MSFGRFQLYLGLLITSTSLCTPIGAVAQETEPASDPLRKGTPIRALIAELGEGWHLGQVVFTANPRCSAVQLEWSDGITPLAAVDSLEIRVVAEADTTWRAVSVSEILAKEPGCPQPIESMQMGAKCCVASAAAAGHS